VSLELAILLAALGLVASFFSGLLGIGGALIVVPLLLYVPDALGLPSFDIKAASAIAVAQVATAAGSGTLANVRRGGVYWRLAGVLLTAMVTGGFAGGWASQWVPPGWLALLAAGSATLAALVMLLPLRGQESGPDRPPFKVPIALVAGLGVGSTIGLVGTGAFLLIPVQVYLLGLPIRTAIATSLAAGFPSALAALAGKASAGQVPWPAAIAVCLPALPGAQLGIMVGARMRRGTLRRIYALTILLVAVSLWYEALRPH
jgi:uncharacterized membrane protein YfcA